MLFGLVEQMSLRLEIKVNDALISSDRYLYFIYLYKKVYVNFHIWY